MKTKTNTKKSRKIENLKENEGKSKKMKRTYFCTERFYALGRFAKKNEGARGRLYEQGGKRDEEVYEIGGGGGDLSSSAAATINGRRLGPARCA